MAYTDTNDLKAGEMLKAAFAVIGQHPVAFGVYILFLIVLTNFAGPLFTPDILPFATFMPTIIAWVAQFALFGHMLNGGIRGGLPWRRLPSFILQALVVSIVTGLVANFFLVPALLLGARWILAPSYMVREGAGAFQSLGLSWQATSGGTLHTTLALSALTAMSAVLFVVQTVLTGILGFGEGGIFASMQLVFIGALAMSVGVYRLMDRDHEALTEVFA